MYDDFDYMISLRRQGLKVMTVNRLISNFSFGGMSTIKTLSDVKKRAEVKYAIYKRHNLPRIYKIHCYAMEIAKYVLG